MTINWLGGYNCYICGQWVYSAGHQHACTGWPKPPVQSVFITADEVRRIVREEIDKALLAYNGRDITREWKPPV